ncbi:hypothetical protein CTI12_AA043490 [Artemisia annua]|uniref:Uncharacterized protein n=1 Tax=Artemisia annua TaxID=35608 RepID=A0A2U1QDR3_ARTAN|nr:hypothetical protein CTI12_AA043490 [Artemisia annua]
MTGESKIVHKDPKAPFLMSDCKVADGAGTMLVTNLLFTSFTGSKFKYLIPYGLYCINYETCNISLLGVVTFSQVTSVGINTEWGLLMASICEDTGEETPLQVYLFCYTWTLFIVMLLAIDLLLQFDCGELQVLHWLAYSMKKMMVDKALKIDCNIIQASPLCCYMRELHRTHQEVFSSPRYDFGRDHMKIAKGQHTEIMIGIRNASAIKTASGTSSARTCATTGIGG